MRIGINRWGYCYLDILIEVEEYEWRWKIENSQLNKRNFLKPLWLGSEFFSR